MINTRNTLGTSRHSDARALALGFVLAHFRPFVGALVRLLGRPLGWNMKDDDAKRLMHLGRRQTGAAGIRQRLHHVGDQSLDLGRARIGDLRRFAS